MTTYEVKLKMREEVAEGTMAFHFDKPPTFSFKPGQAIDVVLINLPTTGAQDSRHTFSLVSAPFHADLVKTACGALSAPIYYLAGPPVMVGAMRQTLHHAGVDDDDIRSEEFYGY